jgi:hypothetical protein
MLRSTINRSVYAGVRHPFQDHDQIYVTVRNLVGLLIRDVLSDDKSGLSFTIATGVRVQRDSQPYFTVPDSRHLGMDRVETPVLFLSRLLGFPRHHYLANAYQWPLLAELLLSHGCFMAAYFQSLFRNGSSCHSKMTHVWNRRKSLFYSLLIMINQMHQYLRSTFLPVRNVWRRMKCRYSSTIPKLGPRWIWVVSFTPRQLRTPEKEPGLNRGERKNLIYFRECNSKFLDPPRT